MIRSNGDAFTEIKRPEYRPFLTDEEIDELVENCLEYGRRVWG